jgi:ABC-type multidrug transport system ATPase subunit
MDEVIRIQGLTKHFGNLHAVNNLSFTVNKSDIYGFLGQNGAGKSTTIRMLLTLIAPTAGSIEMLGMNLNTHRREILQRVGAIIEKPDLYKYLTAFENLSIFAKMSRVRPDSRKIMAQLELVGLADRAHSKVKTFSQGMKQRLGIAISLVHDPDLIILDEPTNGLDPQGIADIRNLILHLSHHVGKTIVISSHLLSEIEQIANRMLIIDKGNKIVEGTVDELFNAAKTTVRIETTDHEKSIRFLQQTKWNHLLLNHKNNQLILQIHKNDIPLLNADLVGAEIGVVSIQAKNSLEEYFLSLTGDNQHVAAFTN